MFFSLTGLGVITGRLVVGRAARASSTGFVIVSTVLSIAGMAALAVEATVVTGAVGGLTLGLGSGILMQVLTDRLTLLPSYQHGRQLARYSAAVALGLGLGGFAAGLFASAEPVRGPFPAVVALAIGAAAVAIVSQRTTPVSEVARS
ncbi:MAG: hypothetical protein H0W22_09400 [Chloroflexi bacterium]|nr:hypothetical protein [Chloroflexota bacterium]